MQWIEEEGRVDTTPKPPSVFNIPIALLSFLFCPILGLLAVIFAIEVSLSYNISNFGSLILYQQARLVYKQGHYLESEALCERARGTSYYAIGIGIGLGLGMGILLGLGDRFDWY